MTTQPASLPVALDSGAFSLYMRHGAPRRPDGVPITGKQNFRSSLVNHSYCYSDEFREYLDSYMAFLHVYGEEFAFKVALDVLFNAERSWEVYKEMRDEGFEVMPVYHYGEDLRWLKRYMDTTDYIGLGGLAASATVTLEAQERAWRVMCDSKGRPLVRVHGFGVTGMGTIRRHPYYSIDSTAAFTWGRYGGIGLPRKNGNGFDYCASRILFRVTGRVTRDARHVDKFDGRTRDAITEYLTQIGLTLDQLRGRDDVPTDSDEARFPISDRDVANLFFMHKAMEQVSREQSQRLGVPLRMIYYASGAPTAGPLRFARTLRHLQPLGALTNLAYLGSFDAFNLTRRIIRTWKPNL